MSYETIIDLSIELSENGLIWNPEIGDEVAPKPFLNKVSVLVDPKGLTPSELRRNYLWLPNIEQSVSQIEARQGLIHHAGLTKEFLYQVIIKTSEDNILTTCAKNLRIAFVKTLNLMISPNPEAFSRDLQ